MNDRVKSGWFKYRCEDHGRTTYVNARHGVSSDRLCCEACVLVDVATEHEFCDALRAAGGIPA